ncbi:MAG: Coenzyme hydrogenase subunit beta [Thermoproteota archaeon]|nr:Coenzyme hydrogenase subunit beta [Thermoproteota archaeon]
MKEKTGFDTLLAKVISSNACLGCSACSIVCPFKGVLGFREEKPVLIGECKNCGICASVCPRFNIQIGEIEEFIFNRKRKSEETFGINKEIYVARTTNKEILEKCQDGGVATSLLVSSLDLGDTDCSVISGIDPEHPWLPKPLLATKRKEIMMYSGTRYTYSPNLIAYGEAISKRLQKIAFIGTPCQILALRRIQMSPLKKYSNTISFTLGLFCSECFSYEGLIVNKIQRDLRIDLREILKMNIKGRLLIQKMNREIIGIPLKELKAYSSPRCELCNDFSAELADISLGGVGLDGWTFTILRTNKGLEVFRNAQDNGILEVKPVEEFPSALNLLLKLSSSKRERGKKDKP